MNMTKRADLGVWIAGLSGVVIAGAVIAGLFAAGNPADVRAERIDALRISTMREIATAAQCAYTYTGEVPTDIRGIESALLERRRAVAACDHISLPTSARNFDGYEAEPPDRVTLCAEFLRPSPPSPSRPEEYITYRGTEFPELHEERPVAGRYCYRVRLVDQSTADLP
jgi:hypothetical protein